MSQMYYSVRAETQLELYQQKHMRANLHSNAFFVELSRAQIGLLEKVTLWFLYIAYRVATNLENHIDLRSTKAQILHEY